MRLQLIQIPDNLDHKLKMLFRIEEWCLLGCYAVWLL
jgi:hypothetical protein